MDLVAWGKRLDFLGYFCGEGGGGDFEVPVPPNHIWKANLNVGWERFPHTTQMVQPLAKKGNAPGVSYIARQESVCHSPEQSHWERGHLGGRNPKFAQGLPQWPIGPPGRACSPPQGPIGPQGQGGAEQKLRSWVEVGVDWLDFVGCAEGPG